MPSTVGSTAPSGPAQSNTNDGDIRVAEQSDSPIVDKAADASRAALDKVVESAAQAEKSIRSSASDAGERVREAGEQAKIKGAQAQDTVAEQSRKVRNYIVANPVASAGIAFAAGVVLSRLLRR